MDGPVQPGSEDEKSFIDLSDAELEDRIRKFGRRVRLPYPELVAELNRRADLKQAAEAHRLTRVSLVLAFLSFVAAAAAVVVAALRP